MSSMCARFDRALMDPGVDGGRCPGHRLRHAGLWQQHDPERPIRADQPERHQSHLPALSRRAQGDRIAESPGEQLTLRHSGDFAGRPDDFEFEWRTLPPVDGLPSTLPPAQWVRRSAESGDGRGAVDITIAGPGLQTLSDNYFVCRYRRVNGQASCGADWSDWTEPMLAEGWIKRVLAGSIRSSNGSRITRTPRSTPS
jgi:hypothetical protein